jgi:hypothetical protein
VRRDDLTDDELWHAIAENTSAMSALINRQLELDETIRAADAADRAKLMRCHLDMINRYQREYRDYTGELRRRHRIGESIGQPIAGASAKRISGHASIN